MKEQLKKIFSDAYIFVNDTKSESYIKVESLDDTSPTYYQKGNFNIGLYFNRANSFRNSNAGSYNKKFHKKSRKTNPVNKTKFKKWSGSPISSLLRSKNSN